MPAISRSASSITLARPDQRKCPGEPCRGRQRGRQGGRQGRAYEYPLVRVFEIGDDSKIGRLRVCFDKLGIGQHVARQYPGIGGWIFRKLINFVVGQGEKGLRRM